MSLITIQQLKKICKGKPNAAQTTNMNSYATAVNDFGPKLGLDKLYNLAAQIGQVMVESGEFKYDQEIASGKAYQGRKDLGNTQKGDGVKFKGRGPIQLTGRNNVTGFYNWALKNYTRLGFPKPPNFVKDPKLINTDPWEGMGALWYWDEGNPEGISLNKYSKENNLLMVTKRINGGTNHLAERIEYTVRAGLVLLGYGVSKDEIKRFQKEHKSAGTPDGVIGDKTQAAVHLALGGKLPVTAVKVEKTKEQVAVPVKLASLDKPWYQTPEGISQAAGGTVFTTAASFLMDADVMKILLLAGLAAVGFGVWYYIRRQNAAKQDQKADAIRGDVLDSETTSTVKAV